MAKVTAQVDLEALGRRIKQLRLERGLSQETLAEPNYTAAYISHLEKGKRTASPAALEHLAKKLRVTVDHLATGRDPNRDLELQIEVDRAMAETHSGNIDEAHGALERVRKQARRERYEGAEAAAEEGLGIIEKRRRNWNEAISHFEAAERILAGEPPEVRTSALAQRAGTLFMMNDLHRSIHVLETHLDELEDTGTPDPVALLQVYSFLIAPYFEAGFRDKAAEMAERAHRLETKVHDPEHVACLNINRAQILLQEGRRDEAMRALARAEDLFKAIGWRASAAKAAVAQAHAAVDAGDLELGEAKAREALVELEEVPSVLDQARTFNLLARIARMRGDIEKAFEHLNRVDKLLKGQSAMESAWALRERALCEIATDELANAEKLLKRSLKIYRGGGSPEQIATTSAYLGDVLTKQGRAEEALKIYRQGLEKVEDLAV